MMVPKKCHGRERLAPLVHHGPAPQRTSTPGTSKRWSAASSSFCCASLRSVRSTWTAALGCWDGTWGAGERRDAGVHDHHRQMTHGEFSSRFS